MLVFHCFAQPPQYNFKHFAVLNGLSNDAVRGITQDKYGFIWIGTAYGLNRFDGANVKKYFHKAANNNSIANNFVRSLFCDSRGRIWIGSDPGFSVYNYKSDDFTQYQNASSNMLAIAEDPKGIIWVATSEGLKWVDTVAKKLMDKTAGDTSLNRLLHKYLRDLVIDKNGKIYMATNEGIVIADFGKDEWMLIHKQAANPLISSDDIQNLTLDNQNRIWASINYKHSILYCIEADRKSSHAYNWNQKLNGVVVPNSIRKILCDDKNRVWLGSNYFGLTLFDEQTKTFTNYVKDPLRPNSLSTTQCAQLFRDRTGIIWVGSEGHGINYFHPNQGIFSGVDVNPYIKNTLPSQWVRVATEDKDGNLWLGTGGGISVYNFEHGVLRNYSASDNTGKQLTSYSIRSLLYDHEGNVWIGTAETLHRFHPSTNKMDSFGVKTGLPQKSFYQVTYQLRNGKILVGNSNGLFEYLPDSNKFYSFQNHKVLGKYNASLKCFSEDKNGYWWIGTFNQGVVIYDPKLNKVIRHLAVDSGTLQNDFIQQFCEDSDGNMWFGTREGLVFYNLQQNKTTVYGFEQGLPDVWISGLRFDKLGRLWIGTAKGLCVMNKERKIIRVFGPDDGLPATQFNDQDAFETRSGIFVFPSYTGFVFFRPEEFNWQQQQPATYFTSFKVLNSSFHNSMNLEELQQIKLQPNQNFFSFEFAGLNYLSPNQCWYAYKLEGFDRDWVITKERVVNYTNVPSGNYVFRLKTTLDPANWNVPEKRVKVFIDTPFYKTWWFALLMSLLFLAILVFVYRYRIRNAEKLHLLQTQAQALEKEKALVMYENLKQHLNPHFLFNSLTSLSSLIRIDQQMAGDFLDKMSKVYRYILKNRDNETVPLSEELKFVDLYIQLQKTRFENGLEVNVNIDEEYYHRKIAPVTLQNLVENAIKHNIVDVDSPLKIDLFIENNYLIVTNNLQKKSFVETSNKQGLANMKSLYKYLSERPMIINETHYSFTVKIPLL